MGQFIYDPHYKNMVYTHMKNGHVLLLFSLMYAMMSAYKVSDQICYNMITHPHMEAEPCKLNPFEVDFHLQNVH